MPSITISVEYNELRLAFLFAKRTRNGMQKRSARHWMDRIGIDERHGWFCALCIYSVGIVDNGTVALKALGLSLSRSLSLGHKRQENSLSLWWLLIDPGLNSFSFQGGIHLLFCEMQTTLTTKSTKGEKTAGERLDKQSGRVLWCGEIQSLTIHSWVCPFWEEDFTEPRSVTHTVVFLSHWRLFIDFYCVYIELMVLSICFT